MLVSLEVWKVLGCGRPQLKFADGIDLQLVLGCFKQAFGFGGVSCLGLVWGLCVKGTLHCSERGLCATLCFWGAGRVSVPCRSAMFLWLS